MSVRRSHALEAIALIVALVCLGYGWLRLSASQAGLTRTDTEVNGTPVTVIAPQSAPSAPVVVVAHGFAGCRQLMQAFSYTLAESGYVAVAFDFPGHGTHPRPLGGTLGSPERMASLRSALRSVVEFARKLEASDGRLALLGHSMAGEVLVQHAADDPDVAAIVGLSPYIAKPPASDAFDAPLLIAYGGLEADLLLDMGREAVAAAAEDVDATQVEVGETYGSSGQRRLVIVDGAEHIGILFAPAALQQAVAWLDAAFGIDRSEAVPLRPRRGALAAWYLGVMLLAFVLARRLPPVSAEPVGAGLRGWRFVAAASTPALLTPLVLTLTPSDFLPSILTDYIALHLAVYGLITFAVLGRAGARGGDLWRGLRPGAFAAALGATLIFELVFLGLATDHLLAAYFPGPNRAAATVVAFIGAAIWFAGDEWLTGSPDAPRGGYVATKALFLGSLIFAVVLNPSELFFLVLIIPAVLALFVVYGTLSAWIRQQTGHPLVAAVAHALAFALPISATFPVVE